MTGSEASRFEVDEPVTAANGVDEKDESVQGRHLVGDYIAPTGAPMFKNRRRLTDAEALAQRRRRALRRRRRRAAGLVLLGLGSFVLLAGGWAAWRTYQAYHHLEAAAAQVSSLQAELRDPAAIDVPATKATLVELQGSSAAAESAVADPVFRLAAALPWVGPNLRALSEIAGTVRSLSVDVVPSLVGAATNLRPAALAPRRGVIDLAPILQVAPSLQAADTAVNAARSRLAGIDGSRLGTPVRKGLPP